MEAIRNIETAATRSIDLTRHAFLSLTLSTVTPILGHRASVKRFVSHQFLNLRQSVGLLGREISPRKAATYTNTK
jgi:hypothetical protein